MFLSLSGRYFLQLPLSQTPLLSTLLIHSSHLLILFAHLIYYPHLLSLSQLIPAAYPISVYNRDTRTDSDSQPPPGPYRTGLSSPLKYLVSEDF